MLVVSKLDVEDRGVDGIDYNAADVLDWKEGGIRLHVPEYEPI